MVALNRLGIRDFQDQGGAGRDRVAFAGASVGSESAIVEKIMAAAINSLEDRPMKRRRDTTPGLLGEGDGSLVVEINRAVYSSKQYINDLAKALLFLVRSFFVFHQDILSASSVDPHDERSVALPQESWSGISPYFHRSVFEAINSGGHNLLDNGGFSNIIYYQVHGLFLTSSPQEWPWSAICRASKRRKERRGNGENTRY